MKIGFEWDPIKNIANQQKHNVSFEEAQYAFADAKRIFAEDLAHKSAETRYYCFGNVNGEIMTVRFTYRNNKIRIFGAGYWRKGKKLYEEIRPLHR
jgi:uncharacterized DUF497 family protein